MKKIISTLLFSFAVTILSAAPFKARLDIAGDGKVALKSVSAPNGGFFSNITWGKKENRKFSLFGETAVLPDWEWVKVSFSFIPENDGKIRVILLSNYGKTNGKINAHWIYYDMISVKGAELLNGDFEKSLGGKPLNWSCKKNQYITRDFDCISGKAAVKAWHNKPCIQQIIVKKGQKVTITLNVQTGELEEPAK